MEGKPTGELLSFRDRETKTYYSRFLDIPPDIKGYLYIVRLLETPSFPTLTCPDSHELAVVCGRLFSDGWGWITLDPDAKEEVGSDLSELHRHMPVDAREQWVYMVVNPPAVLPEKGG